jgi:type VII secretion protein EccB
MASRRDELNAYTFARKRTVAAFLQPSPTGSEEGAPRPLRTVLPSLVVGALIVAGFGALGLFKPDAPQDWDKPDTSVIVGKQSTTRYVVLTTGTGKNKQVLLHPVLNLASARLLLNPENFSVVQVSDDILDAGKPPRGAVLGIPNAPDRLPSASEAGKTKHWAVCERPGAGRGSSGEANVEKAAFVFSTRDFKRTEGPGKLTGGQTMYVQDTQDHKRYIVSANGTKYEVTGAVSDPLTRILIGNAQPEPVTGDWLATLHTGTPVGFPDVPDIGAPAHVGGGLTPTEDRVGTVLRAPTGSGPQQYVVLPGKVQPVTDFTAWLLVNSEDAAAHLGGSGGKNAVMDVDAAAISPETTFFDAGKHWPKARSTTVNSASGGRDTVCGVLDRTRSDGSTTLSAWAGGAYPATIPDNGGTSTYVTPGSGELYTEVQGGRASAGGSMFLVTDTGLRYAVQANGDSDSKRSKIGAGDDQKTQDGSPQPSGAQARLGYQAVTPAPVPVAWSDWLSKGPRLDTNSARQPQGS